MKMTRMALLAGAALAVTTAGAQADDLDALKAQIESLNARVAAMETAPSVPAGYQLIAVSEGELQQAPGLGMTARELAAYGNTSTIISVLPTADAPAGATISWSGYARSGLVYTSTSVDTGEDSADSDDIDVLARGQLRVKATTDTAVGEVGVDIRLRANFNGNGNADVYSDVAWGYWAMTPELTFGGGYAGSLGNIGYGYDGACTCYYTDNAGVDFNPGDVTQMRLSYASGPLSFAVALEDASTDGDKVSGKELGAAGEIKFSGDTFSAEISGVWRGVNEKDYTAKVTGATVSAFDANIDSLWQVGAGAGLALGDIVNLSVGAAMGEGPSSFKLGSLAESAYMSKWWGVSALASADLSDEIRIEVAGGYKKREAEDVSISLIGVSTPFSAEDGTIETLAALGGIYYEPVDQLTLGVEAEWYRTDTEFSVTPAVAPNEKKTTTSVNLVSVWRF
jgi:hypothetical protein